LSGIGAKPDDRWALPLTHTCHMAQHDYHGELQWWADRQIKDPFALCIDYYWKFKTHKEQA